MSTDGYFTFIGGDLDRQHRYVDDDSDELHHIPKQEIHAETNVNEDCVNPTWIQEKYTKRAVGVNGVTIQFFGISSWSDADCLQHSLFRYHMDSREDRQDAND